MSTITLSTTQKTTFEGIDILLERVVVMERKEETVNDVFDSLTYEQEQFTYYVLGEVIRTEGEYKLIDARYDTRKIVPCFSLEMQSTKDFIESLSDKQYRVLDFLMNNAAKGNS